jgi:hypothetical protein
MVGDEVDGVWETGRVVFEEELVVIPFSFKSALISPSILDILSRPFIFSLLIA